MKDKELSAFKDGVADAILEGHKAEWHKNISWALKSEIAS